MDNRYWPGESDIRTVLAALERAQAQIAELTNSINGRCIITQSYIEQIADLTQQLATAERKAQADGARLDWLEDFFSITDQGSTAWKDFESAYWEKGYRAAIDAAMAPDAAKKATGDSAP